MVPEQDKANLTSVLKDPSGSCEAQSEWAQYTESGRRLISRWEKMAGGLAGAG